MGSRAGRERCVYSIIDEVWEWSRITGCRGKNTSFHQPWKPRSMKCWAHCTFSAPIFWITYKFWNIQELILTFVSQKWFNHLNCAFLTCKGCIPEAMRSLIIRTWARFFGSAGISRGPGLVSSMYWITASCVSKKPFHLYSSRLTKIWVCRIY